MKVKGKTAGSKRFRKGRPRVKTPEVEDIIEMRKMYVSYFHRNNLITVSSLNPIFDHHDDDLDRDYFRDINGVYYFYQVKVLPNGIEIPIGNYKI